VAVVGVGAVKSNLLTPLGKNGKISFMRQDKGDMPLNDSVVFSNTMGESPGLDKNI
jgi:hypothetical protein